MARTIEEYIERFTCAECPAVYQWSCGCFGICLLKDEVLPDWPEEEEGMVDDSGAPFVATTDYDRRVLRALEIAGKRGVRAYVWVDPTTDNIVITPDRPPGRVCTVCTPGQVAVNLSPEADESLIPEEG